MATIAGYTVFSARAQNASLPGMRGRDKTPPGASGVTLMFDGIKADPFEIFAKTKLGSGADNIDEVLADYSAKKGTVISCTDDFGATWTFLYVHDVVLVDVVPLLGVVPVTSPVTVGMMDTRWTVQDISY